MDERKKEILTEEQLRELIPELPTGRLDNYRKKASFNWRRMKLVYEDVEALKTKNEVWSFMRQHPLFQHPNITLPLDEDRRLTTQRMYALYTQNLLPIEKIVQHPNVYTAETEAMFMYDASLAIKLSLTFRMCANVIRGSGKSHHYHFVEELEQAKIGGCFALTEISHGSNAKGMRTTATYCPEKKQFILHTADFEAAKCWVGSLGKCSTHAVLYAMLISKGINHGLHTFVVPIRDPQTLKAYPGVVVGDLGEKIGLNGVDNGFVMFNNYHLPKEALLDKLGGVDDNGDYKTPFRDPNKRFGASLGILSGGRVYITTISTNYLQKAIVIAIRYSAIRKQFGPENSTEEIPVLEYQQQQIRLIPYLAATYAMRIFSNWFSTSYVVLNINSMMGIDDDAAAKGIEIHALSSAAKPMCGWTARDGIQNCREACGGHGYLKASAIGNLRNDNDANCTYEGENSLLLQQTSNWLLNMWGKRHEKGACDTPYGSLQFLKDADVILTKKCPFSHVEELIRPENLLQMYSWLTAYTLKMTHEKVSRLKNEGKNSFEAKNDSQSYNAVVLSVIYAENFILHHFFKTASNYEDEACKKVLLKLVSLYGSWMLEKHLATLYIGGYFYGDLGLQLREGVLRLCADIVPEAVALADTLAPPDWCLNSVLGSADGEAYKNIQNNILTYPGSMSRPDWWKDVVFWESYVTSKL